MFWREEQRAIGELMLASGADDQLRCLGYASFVEQYDQRFAPWFETFVDDLQTEDVAGSQRLAALQELLTRLVLTLDAEGVYTEIRDGSCVVVPGWGSNAMTERAVAPVTGDPEAPLVTKPSGA